MLEISGTTKIFPVIGWPVEQVKAPILFNSYFKKYNIDARVIPLKIEPEKYIAAVKMLMAIENIGGIFVSIPHKPMSVAAVDNPTSRATLAGACNAIYKTPDGTIIGDLIDGEGFVSAFDRTCAAHQIDFNFATAKALIVGTGGVGCAIAEALAARGMSHIAIVDNRAAQAQDLQRRLQLAFPHTHISIAQPNAAGFDLVVNSTPLGMHVDDDVPINLEGISPHCIVADCGMKIEMTKLLTQAQAHGCPIQKGKEMLIEQAPLYLELFGFGKVASDEFRALGAL